MARDHEFDEFRALRSLIRGTLPDEAPSDEGRDRLLEAAARAASDHREAHHARRAGRRWGWLAASAIPLAGAAIALFMVMRVAPKQLPMRSTLPETVSDRAISAPSPSVPEPMPSEAPVGEVPRANERVAPPKPLPKLVPFADKATHKESARVTPRSSSSSSSAPALEARKAAKDEANRDRAASDSDVKVERSASGLAASLSQNSIGEVRESPKAEVAMTPPAQLEMERSRESRGADSLAKPEMRAPTPAPVPPAPVAPSAMAKKAVVATPEPSPRALFERGQQLLRDGKTEQARAEFKRLIERYPDDVDYTPKAKAELKKIAPP